MMGLGTWWGLSPLSWYLRLFGCQFPGIFSCMAASRATQSCAKCGSQNKFNLCPLFLVPLFPFVSTEQRFAIRLPINAFCFQNKQRHLFGQWAVVAEDLCSPQHIEH